MDHIDCEGKAIWMGASDAASSRAAQMGWRWRPVEEVEDQPTKGRIPTRALGSVSGDKVCTARRIVVNEYPIPISTGRGTPAVPTVLTTWR